MKLLDVNLLIYAVNADAPLHSPSKAWLEGTISGPETVAFSWNVLLAFLRLTTRPGLFQTALSLDAAFDVIGSWMDQPTTAVLIRELDTIGSYTNL